jgi:hypothetical protein
MPARNLCRAYDLEGPAVSLNCERGEVNINFADRFEPDEEWRDRETRAFVLGRREVKDS